VRFYILDDLASPASGRGLTVENAEIVERDGPAVERCRNWCGRLGATPEAASDADCGRCGRIWIERGTLSDGEARYPITAGIPRFVVESDADVDADTQESFGYEWQHFDKVLPDYDAEIENYFGIVPPDALNDAVVLDAGCGMGRWAVQVAKRPVRRLYAVDFSRAVDSAARTLANQPQAHCIQADVTRLPFRSGAIDFSYCLGVLHHLSDPDAGMSSLARVTKGPLLVYLYYALDNRPAFHRVLLWGATVARLVTARLPKQVMLWLSWCIGTVVYWPLARLAQVFERLGFPGIAHQIPLSHYRSYSLKFMAGDAFDRFATPIEKRYSRAQIAAWLARYGRDARFSDHTPFWVSLGTPKK
jgi:SAM-dependent methyltransferase